VARTVDTLPRMQAEAQEYLPLEEVPAGEPYRMRGVAPPADNLMDRGRHYCVGYFLGSLPHMKYALQGSLLAICFKTGWSPDGGGSCGGLWIARRGPESGLSALHEVGEFEDNPGDGQDYIDTLGLLSVVALRVDATAGDLVGERGIRVQRWFGGATGGGCAEENVVGNDGPGVGGTRKVVWRGRRAATLCEGESWGRAFSGRAK
jgi:hypothetical protein